jgi:hypothetical protein
MTQRTVVVRPIGYDRSSIFSTLKLMAEQIDILAYIGFWVGALILVFVLGGLVAVFCKRKKKK